MKPEDKQTLIEKLNRYAAAGEAFVFAVDAAGERGFVLPAEAAAEQGILFSIGGVRNYEEQRVPTLKLFDLEPVPYERFEKAFSIVNHHLERGDTYLLNLTFPTPVRCNLTAEELFRSAVAPYKLLVPGMFTVFSPEPFVRISGDRIFSNPMKGTADAALPDAERLLLADDKEFFEHNTIVDLIRNDLSMVSVNVKVSRFRYIDRIRTNRGELLQMSSEICGDLPPGWRSRLGDILFTLLPAGSVTGAPKQRTVEIIRAAEPDDRGFYTGIFGRFDGRELVSAVSIRFIEQRGDEMLFRSGGGITALSDPRKEYDEMVSKVYVPVV